MLRGKSSEEVRQRAQKSALLFEKSKIPQSWERTEQKSKFLTKCNNHKLESIILCNRTLPELRLHLPTLPLLLFNEINITS